jgi:uncharacterized small protein (DUF1192 family)
MAKTKAELIKEGKEIGLNLKDSMSVYELTHRIKEKKAELEAEKEKSAPKKATKARISGEH